MGGARQALGRGVAVLLLLAITPAPAAAQSGCQFVLGFAAIRAAIGPGLVGDCLEDEHVNPASGDALQQTTGGLLVWRKADNFTAFTDGARTWIDGPHGLQSRANGDCLWWEACPGRPAPAVPVSAEEVARGDPARPWISLIFNAGAGYAP